MDASSPMRFCRRHPIGLSAVVAMLVLVVFFDWNWFRHPLERYISKKNRARIHHF